MGKVNFSAETFWLQGDFQSDVIQPEVRGETRLSLDSSLKLGRMRVPVQLAARRTVWRDGTKVNEWLMRGSITTRKVSFTAEFGKLWTDRPYGPPAPNDGLELNLLANTRVGNASLRGEMRFLLSGPSKGLNSASLVGEIPVGERSDLRAELSYLNTLHRADFDLGYIQTFKRFSLQASGRIGTDGTVGAGVSLAFSMGPDPVDGGVRFSSEKLARTGQTGVTVFRDDNGDGQLSPGEQPLAGVTVDAGLVTSKEPTDKNGHAIIEGMQPYVPVLVSVDTGSLPDPFLQPQGKGIVVTPRPGVATSIMLPLSPTGEIDGTIYDAAGSARAGVQIELVDALGQVVAKTISEFDGYFVFETVTYGTYTIRLAPSSANALSAASGIASGVAVSRDHDSVQLGILHVKPAGIAGNEQGAPSRQGG